jgi:peptidoglycan/LPS O-acetylase OafA/YrhL
MLAVCAVCVGLVVGANMQHSVAWSLPFLPHGPGAITVHWRVELGAILIFVGLLLLPEWQRLLAAPLPQYLGRLSFSIYLLHWPIMVAAGSAVFLVALPLGHTAAAALAFIVGLAFTLGLAAWFELYIDALAVRLSRRIRIGSFKRSAPPIITSV